MADSQYKTHNFILRSRGLVARTVSDCPPGESFYQNMDGLQEIEENALASRFGTTLLSKSGGAALPLGGSSGIVHSLSKLPSLNGNTYRYGGKGTGLYRLSGSAPGGYTQISNALSGQPWTAVQYNPETTSYPLLFIADQAGVLKDNGTLAAPQTAGILQPQIPLAAESLQPDLITLDNYTSSAGYVYSGISPGSLIPVVNCHTSSAVGFGVLEVSVTAPQQIGLFQLLTIDTGGNQETVLVLQVTATGFVADFTKIHSSGVSVTSQALDMSVPAATTGSVSLSFGGTPISAWPTTLDQADYIGIYVRVSDPTQIQSITLKFDCGDGTFTQDFFWRTIGQGPLQSFLNTTTDSSTAAADAVLSDTLGVYSSDAGGVSPLNTGQFQWTPILIQLSDFSSTGRANFNDPVFNWQNVNGYQVEITTNNNGVGATLDIAALILFGGAGPDTLGGVAYDYLFTFLNINDLTESNPCMVMSNVNPPNQTNWVYPRRQPVLVTIKNNASLLNQQITHVRIYRRGGTLGDNYRRIDQVVFDNTPSQILLYTDIYSDDDIAENDTISFTNDVPVTSALPVPVNTTLSTAITGTNAVRSVFPASMASISVSQQVDIGNVSDPNFETVIVISIASDHFTAFVQNTHVSGELISATAAYGQPVDIIAVAFDTAYYAGDPNNPSTLYKSQKGAIQYVSSDDNTPVSVPSDPITAVVSTAGNVYVSTITRWWQVPTSSGAAFAAYPTQADKGCVGKNAWCLRNGKVYFLAVDGPRVMVAGQDELISEIIQGVWQGTPTTVLPVADSTQFASAFVAYWNQYVVFSYIGVDTARHRMILDVEQMRWRNDHLDAQSMFFEDDTNQLVWGDSQGLVHLDMQLVNYDEGAAGSAVVENAIPISLLTPYTNEGTPDENKNWNNFVLDANTNGAAVTVTVYFNDGQSSQVLGNVTTTQRQRVNLNMNGGLGFTAFKAALGLTGSGSQRIFLYQAAMSSLVMAKTRQSFDTYWRDGSIADSKICRLVYLDYASSAPILFNLYYDGSSTPYPGYPITIPSSNGVRETLKLTLPPVKFRLIRMTLTSTSDFMLWGESNFWIKSICQGRGYSKMPILNPES